MLVLLNEPLSSQLLEVRSRHPVACLMIPDRKQAQSRISTLWSMDSPAHTHFTHPPVISPSLMVFLFRESVGAQCSICVPACVCLHCSSSACRSLHWCAAALVGGPPTHRPHHQLHPDSSKVVSPLPMPTFCHREPSTADVRRVESNLTWGERFRF